METRLKIDLEKVLQQENRIIIDLGCGARKKPGHIGIDQVDLDGIDIIADIEQGLSFLPDRSVDEIQCQSVLEHVKNFELVLREMLRVLKKEGKAYIFVPHFSNPHYYSDPTHVRFFGLYTFNYFVSTEQQLKRKVPSYYSDIRLRIYRQKLVFRSIFALIKPFKKAFGWFINLHPILQEYYEENLIYLIPANGIKLTIGLSD